MKPADGNHFTEKQIVAALVDAADLSTERRDHLDHCDHCRQALTDAKTQLARMGTLAKAHTPGPMRPVRLDAQATTALQQRPWRSGLAWAAAAAALIAIVWSGPWERNSLRPAGEPTIAAGDPDLGFMAEVARLVDDPLPDRYRSLVGDGRDQFEEDFMEFIVPPVNGPAPTTSRQPAKGERPC